MAEYLKKFKDLTEEDFALAGGKGGNLSRLIQKGFPVPDGVVIFPHAFEGSDLKPDAWRDIKKRIDEMKDGDEQTAFAVRSSALAEDSAYASFAGEFETVLDVRSGEAVRAAVLQVRRSRESERVKVYSKKKGIDTGLEIAVVIQRLIRAEISGILFTADPVNGSPFQLKGNFIYGFGEELVSGEAEPYTFTISYPGGEYTGPDELKKYAGKLIRIAMDLVNEFSCPQDIEWTIADGKVYLLQSRPITTLNPYDTETGEWNHTRMGDYVWVNQEVFPDVLTPATWSLFKCFQDMNIYRIPLTGNIHGRFYMNLSLAFKMFELINRSEEQLLDYLALTTGHELKNVTIVEVPLTKGQILKAMLPNMITMLPKQFLLMTRFNRIIEDNPEKCTQVTEMIHQITNKELLANLWQEQVFSLVWDLLQVQDKANEDYFFPYQSAKKELYDLVGKESADQLLSKMTGQSTALASIQPLIKLQRLADGEISREEYNKIAGHRPAHENEVAEPRLYEQDGWIEERLEEYRQNPKDYIDMAEKSRKEFEAVWSDFEKQYPKQSRAIRKKLEKTLNAMEKRENIRSELTRSLGIVRQWFLRIGELSDIGDDVFFLQAEEAIQVLKGDTAPLQEISKRKTAYQRQLERPIYPFVISGNFDMKEWLADKNRRQDVFDSHREVEIKEEAGLLRGHPGSAGRVEGRVRIIHSPTDGDQLKHGEILVASTTNVGWTPIFPRALAVITDVGAPLSHAAIIARELGIPAVVGTGNATLRLKTGERVTVDGSQGVVYLQ